MAYETKVRFTVLKKDVIEFRVMLAVTNSAKSVVLVVDDDPSVLRALRRLISGAGFDVRVFDRPSKVLKDGHLPKTDACLVVDVHLPEMSGVELCEALGACGYRLPVVLITAHPDDGTRALALSAHPVALLIKPFGRAELVNSIQIALNTGKNS